MNKLWILLAVSLIFALIIDYRDRILSAQFPKRRDKIFTFGLILLLSVYCGLRTWWNDTVTYIGMFDVLEPYPEYMENPYDIADGYGFGLVTSIIKAWGFSSQDYLMFFAIITVTSYVIFVRRYAVSMTFCVFLMFATGFYTFSFAAIKQCAATAFCLWAVTYALRGNWIGYLISVVVAMLFHPYAVVYLLVPLMIFKPWTGRTYLYIILFILIGFGLDSLIGSVLDMTTMIGADYTEAEMLGDGVNAFRVIVCFVPLLLSFFYKDILFCDSNRTENLMFNLAMVNALIMFVGLFGTANYFARLANYFLPAQVVALPWMLNKIRGNDRRWLKLACVVCYTGYFYYDNAIVRPFDSGFSQMSLWEYLGSLF